MGLIPEVLPSQAKQIDLTIVSPHCRPRILSVAKKICNALILACALSAPEIIRAEDPQNNAPQAEREHRDSNPKEQWGHTQEAQEVKTKLQTLIRAMDSDQFKARDDAMRKSVTIMSDLRTKVSPIPPEFSEVIDPSLMPWHGSQTEFVNAQKKIGRSREQAARLWNAQESMQKEEFDATPRILAGNYPVKVLIDDLERSTGVKINIEGVPLEQIVTVEENKNAWGDILQNLCSILQRRLRYDHKANVGLDQKCVGFSREQR